MSLKTKFVVNPTAGNQAVSKKWPKVESRLKTTLNDYFVEFTQAKGDAAKITRAAIKDAFENIIVVGGDGTLNEVVNGFFEDGRLINPDTNLGIIPMGTGSDWVRSFDTTFDVEQLVDHIRRRKTSKCDVGRLHCAAESGNLRTHFFINVADAGFGGALAGRVNKSNKAFGSFLSYFLGLLQTLATFKRQIIRIRVDDRYSEESKAFAVVVANGQFFGGGMWVAPKAKMADGLFEVVIIGDMSRTEVLLNMAKLYKGTLAEHPKVTCLRGKRVVLESDADVYLEADGELPGKLPVTFEVLPQALNIFAY